MEGRTARPLQAPSTRSSSIGAPRKESVAAIGGTNFQSRLTAAFDCLQPGILQNPSSASPPLEAGNRIGPAFSEQCRGHSLAEPLARPPAWADSEDEEEMGGPSSSVGDKRTRAQSRRRGEEDDEGGEGEEEEGEEEEEEEIRGEEDGEDEDPKEWSRHTASWAAELTDSGDDEETELGRSAAARMRSKASSSSSSTATAGASSSAAASAKIAAFGGLSDLQDLEDEEMEATQPAESTGADGDDAGGVGGEASGKTKRVRFTDNLSSSAKDKKAEDGGRSVGGARAFSAALSAAQRGGGGGGGGGRGGGKSIGLASDDPILAAMLQRKPVHPQPPEGRTAKTTGVPQQRMPLLGMVRARAIVVALCTIASIA